MVPRALFTRREPSSVTSASLRYVTSLKVRIATLFYQRDDLTSFIVVLLSLSAVFNVSGVTRLLGLIEVCPTVVTANCCMHLAYALPVAARYFISNRQMAP